MQAGRKKIQAGIKLLAEHGFEGYAMIRDMSGKVPSFINDVR